MFYADLKTMNMVFAHLQNALQSIIRKANKFYNYTP